FELFVSLFCGFIFFIFSLSSAIYILSLHDALPIYHVSLYFKAIIESLSVLFPFCLRSFVPRKKITAIMIIAIAKIRNAHWILYVATITGTTKPAIAVPKFPIPAIPNTNPCFSFGYQPETYVIAMANVVPATPIKKAKNIKLI